MLSFIYGYLSSIFTMISFDETNQVIVIKEPSLRIEKVTIESIDEELNEVIKSIVYRVEYHSFFEYISEYELSYSKKPDLIIQDTLKRLMKKPYEKVNIPTENY